MKRRRSLRESLQVWAFWSALVVLAAGVAPLAWSPTPAVAQDGENVGDDGAADGGEPTPEPKKSMLKWAIEALRIPYLIVFLTLSFTFVALLVMNLISARRDAVLPEQLVTQFEQYLEEERYPEAYELAKSDDSFLGHVLEAGLAKISSGYQPALEAMQEVGEEENMKFEHRLSYMALIGTISPMVGLFGTVHGMIDSFAEIANSTQTPPASKLAEGISTALFTTLVGLAIAIPAIAAFNILRNHVSRLVLQVGRTSEGLMSRFEGMGTQA